MNKKTKITLYIIILLAVIGLNLIILIGTKDMSCKKCVVEFKQTKTSGIQGLTKIIPINITDLADSLNQNKCLLRWDRVQGYYYGY